MGSCRRLLRWELIGPQYFRDERINEREQKLRRAGAQRYDLAIRDADILPAVIVGQHTCGDDCHFPHVERAFEVERRRIGARFVV